MARGDIKTTSDPDNGDKWPPIAAFSQTAHTTDSESSDTVKKPVSEETAKLKRPARASGKKRGVPEGLWQMCQGCQATIFRKEAEQLLNVCPQCGYHWYVSAADRITQLLDAGTFEEWNAHLEPTDPLGFIDKKPYADRLKAEQKRTGLRDAALTGTGMIRARRVAVGVTDSAFIMGSMGSVVGERLARLIERATLEKLPLIIISASGGGARMHEGILSLMQMAKVSAALALYSRSGGLYISVITNPTMGGVAASFASLGDLIFAEPRALIGFAGPRTIKATIRVELPKGFQTSEFLLEHGFIDRIVDRKDLKSEIARVIDYCRG
ncbi:MAG: acetyl-CoA carboxylase, carboxyltransferase subunit beta [Planctomycetota bacterium]|jgi:acetyl-CoA carboxylase carboxyl transferase subunit beta|nr:MAG: acetyl-CoA carboxylase carboxyltransferase subunit beta [Planctomycetota bacterium]TSA08916.1 MAG: acetyl-CoA carboxylase carboxyltransferase subunit beta [Planctomycetaceae bacterium]